MKHDHRECVDPLLPLLILACAIALGPTLMVLMLYWLALTGGR